MSVTSPERFAAVGLGVEAVALFALAGWEVIALAGGDSTSVASSIALIVLTVVGAAAVAAFAVAVWRGASWGRSGGVVTQLLALAVALGAVSGADPQPAAAAGIAVPAVIVLAALIAGSRSAARRAAASDADE